MASVKFEEAVALRTRRGGMTNRRDHHKRNGGVDHRVLHNENRWARREILVPDRRLQQKYFSETVTTR
jgi:hypothetical protein